MVLVRYLQPIARHTSQLPIGVYGNPFLLQCCQIGGHILQLVGHCGMKIRLPAFLVLLCHGLQHILANWLHFFLRISPRRHRCDHKQQEYRRQQNNVQQLLFLLWTRGASCSNCCSIITPTTDKTYAHTAFMTHPSDRWSSRLPIISRTTVSMYTASFFPFVVNRDVK